MKLVIAACSFAIYASASADEGQVRLKDAPDRDVVAANCVMCHSLDYIQMNSPFLDRKGWEAVVNKMVKVMGAPVGEADGRKIVDYLSAQYGR